MESHGFRPFLLKLFSGDENKVGHDLRPVEMCVEGSPFQQGFTNTQAAHCQESHKLSEQDLSWPSSFGPVAWQQIMVVFLTPTW